MNYIIKNIETGQRYIFLGMTCDGNGGIDEEENGVNGWMNVYPLMVLADEKTGEIVQCNDSEYKKEFRLVVEGDVKS